MKPSGGTGDSWTTPAEVFEPLVDAYGVPALDPCWAPGAVRAQRVCSLDGSRPQWGDPPRAADLVGTDGLAVDWLEAARGGGEDDVDWIFLNPPYSNPGPWLERLVRSGCPGVALIKGDPSTKWWDKWVWGYARCVGWFRHRLRFGQAGKSGAATFPSALVIYDGIVPEVRGFFPNVLPAMPDVRWTVCWDAPAG